ncbi:glycosyltransferase family 2 protein [Holdemania massiliensis]|uniref:glycosyltransferase family 2 protein n=1 Tax=Holdemania massiliensis TaxID=1468449 RepID=UPI001F05C167|nr:glycosyltransferase family 2 protein [Holdemania massiliensis]MCH1940975.1 glycosyltransferase [Holdemania massiliensis]
MKCIKNEAPLVSVIVPIYKIERYLGLCIESLLNQTYQNIEIVLVNDGSPDRCPEICNIYAKKDERIILINKKNGGLVSARQAGLEMSTGSLICNVDGDDWVDSEFVENLVKVQLETNADAVIAGQTRHFFQNKVKLINHISCGVYEGDELKLLKETMLSCGDFYTIGIFTYVWNKLFKREIIYKHQMNVDTRLSQGEDAACVYPALESCSKICVIDDCSYHYRQREDSMLKSQKPFAQESSYIKLLYEYLCDHLPASYKKQIDDYALHIFTVRSGGILPIEGVEYPYAGTFIGKKIVLCCAGTFGQQLYGKLQNQECEVVAWVDDDYWACRRCCLDVDPLEVVQNVEFDYIVVAALEPYTSKQLTERLKSLGISERKILTITQNEEIRAKALKHYLAHADAL